MATTDPVKKTSGATHSNGTTALSFKKSSPQYSEIKKKKVKTKRLKDKEKDPVPPSQQTRGNGESLTDFFSRRRKNAEK